MPDTQLFYMQVEVARTAYSIFTTTVQRLLRANLFSDADHIVVRVEGDFVFVYNVPESSRLFVHGLLLGILVGSQETRPYVHVWGQAEKIHETARG